MPKADIVIKHGSFKPNRYEEFWNFVAERQKIWYKRHILQKPPPWTKDMVLHENFFTNVYRELDPGTSWVADIILTHPTLKNPSKAFWCLFYRFTGSVETTTRSVLEAHKWQGYKHYSAPLTEEVLRNITNPFGHVYTVYHNVHDVSKDKISNVAELFQFVSKAWGETWTSMRLAPTAKESWYVCRHIYRAIANFNSYQLWVDLNMDQPPIESPLLPWGRDSIVVHGPGSRKGLEYLLKSPSVSSLEPAMRYLHKVQTKELQPRKFQWLQYEYEEEDRVEVLPLYLSDIQNCLCEFSKYVRVRDTRKPTRRFVARERVPIYKEDS